MDAQETPAMDPARLAARGPMEGHGDVDQYDPSFVHRVTPVFKLLRLYSRLEVEGLEQIPDGPAILVSNHTGWIGLDYAYAALSVYDARKRVVRGMTHPAWFKRENIGRIAARLGLHEVSKDTMRALLARDELVLIFPEGERGAFKTEAERYRLQPFAKGYLRVALEMGVPVVPVAILGGEEANPTNGRIDSYEKMLDLAIPVPQNLFPRPVKWRISFLPPRSFNARGAPEADRATLEAWNEDVRGLIQTELERLRTLRGHPFL